MRQRLLKVRCIKRSLPKCSDILRAYDKVQNAYADILVNDIDIIEIFYNVPLEDKSIGDFVSDFVCTKSDGDLMIRECVISSNLTRPRTVKLLNFSYNYWSKRGLKDWGIITDEEK